ncbi:hypothetical protein LX81_03854 [Palleronia aestuarii]|uniref:Uncharacterized protein n=1 Tax=Palleronia aestuarii TaxID=568105 RepID=A0A2W7N019_9RHOB|nr:hypothetical protein [Palleronia aestuarii]PZX11777.1 hypothetical protein LX81_03854 [Palleronia aestuarii]
MKRLIAATLVTLTFGTGAHASHGSEQLASSLGVEPGAYSLPQLVRLQSLRSQDGEQFQIREILDHPEGAGGDLVTHHRTAPDPNLAGWQNLALSAGVEPGRLSPQDLVALKSALEQNDRTRVDFILASKSSDDRSNRSQVSSGAAQLARSVGVEPGLYSIAQLVRLKAYIEDDEPKSGLRIRQILKNPELG